MIRTRLDELVEARRLDARAAGQLETLAGLGAMPDAAPARLMQGAGLLSAGLLGFGLILWIAANWSALGRTGQFALLQSAVLLTCALAWKYPALRRPAGLLALLGIGGLFAYFGQTYQTGADPWQLFALWAVLGLPLCLGVRSDVLWTPWSVVTMTAVALWVRHHTGNHWRFDAADLPAHLLGWTVAVAVSALLSPLGARWSGASTWGFRIAVTQMALMVTLSALGGLFSSAVSVHYALGLVTLGLSIWLLSQRRAFDVFGLCAVVLGADVLLVTGLARLMLNSEHEIIFFSLLLIGLSAAGLLAVSVKWILKLSARA